MPTASHPPHAPEIGAIVTVIQNKSSLFRLLLSASSATQPEMHFPSGPSFGCYRRLDRPHQCLDRDFTACLVIVERIIQLLGLLADHENHCIGPAPADVLGGVSQVARAYGVVNYGDIH